MAVGSALSSPKGFPMVVCCLLSSPQQPLHLLQPQLNPTNLLLQKRMDLLLPAQFAHAMISQRLETSYACAPNATCNLFQSHLCESPN